MISEAGLDFLIFVFLLFQQGLGLFLALGRYLSFLSFLFSWSFWVFVLRRLDALASLAALVTLVAAELVATASVGLSVLAVEAAEVLGDLAGVATALQEDGVLASGALEGELVEGDGTTTSLVQKYKLS